jgi:hypothetical protein
MNEAELANERSLIDNRDKKNNKLRNIGDSSVKYIISNGKLKKIKLDEEQSAT